MLRSEAEKGEEMEPGGYCRLLSRIKSKLRREGLPRDVPWETERSECERVKLRIISSVSEVGIEARRSQDIVEVKLKLRCRLPEAV